MDVLVDLKSVLADLVNSAWRK